jgi:hypothetical protein
VEELEPAVAPEEAPESPEAAAPGGASGAAPVDRLLDIIHELLQRSPNGVMLDVLANRLKTMGFERPPGSPRLVTRVRGFKELDVSPRGLIRLRRQGAAPEAATAAPGEAASAATGEGRRRRRRGGRRSRGAGGEGAPPAPSEG